MDVEDFTILYIIDTTPNSPAVNQLPTQGKKNVCIIAINVKGPITVQGKIDEHNRHQNPNENFKVNIGLCRRQNDQITIVEYICYIFDQVRPVVSHLEVRLPEKPLTPKSIGEVLKG